MQVNVWRFSLFLEESLPRNGYATLLQILGFAFKMRSSGMRGAETTGRTAIRTICWIRQVFQVDARLCHRNTIL
jgi:hypothetical protein